MKKSRGPVCPLCGGIGCVWMEIVDNDVIYVPIRVWLAEQSRRKRRRTKKK